MHYTFSEIIWLILIYSFLGWFVETIVGTIRKKKFVNRGFSSGPFCFIYGTAAVIMIIALEDLERRPVFLFLGCCHHDRMVCGEDSGTAEPAEVVGLFPKTMEF